MAKKARATARSVIDRLLAEGKVTTDEAALLWQGRVEEFFGRTLMALVNGDIRPSTEVVNIVSEALAGVAGGRPPATCDCGAKVRAEFGDDKDDAPGWPVTLTGDEGWPKVEVFANRDVGNPAVDVYVKGTALTRLGTDAAFTIGCGLANDLVPPQFVRLHLPLPDGDYYVADLTDPGKRGALTNEYGAAIAAVLAKQAGSASGAFAPHVARYVAVEAEWPEGRPRYDSCVYDVHEDAGRVVAFLAHGAILPDARSALDTCAYLVTLRQREPGEVEVVGHLPDGHGGVFDLPVPPGAVAVDLLERWAAKVR